ncbi:MAG: thioredoxin family protein [Alphaproteobacteria bacterium]|nr:thioredoxin family protein [Alphaproteobacteria bacterium]
MSLSSESRSTLKKVLNLSLVILGIGFLVVLFLFRGSMTNLVSKKMTEQARADTKKTVAQMLDSAYNYQKNGMAFRITFLEFGATGCISCRKMELVMKEVRKKYQQKVNVIFYNVLLPENQDFMKYYGIAAIPTQVLLGPSGREIFRHSGYYSFYELEHEFKKSNL